MKQLRKVCIIFQILSSREGLFMARRIYHGMIGLASNNKTHDNFVSGMINCWPQIPGSSTATTRIMSYRITNYSSCQNPTLLRGVIRGVKAVICRVKGIICRVKGVIMRNWATTHFQKFKVFRVWYGSQTMGVHNAHSEIEKSCSEFFDTGTMASPSPFFGFMGFLVLSSFALFHIALATCANSRHQHL